MVHIASWNVNGIRASVKSGDFQGWLESSAPDIAGIQEAKATPSQVEDVWATHGYEAYWHPAQKAGYSGALLLTRIPPRSVTLGLGIDRFDEEGRVVQAEFDAFTLITAYFPNAGRGEDRMRYKLEFFDAFLAHCDALRAAGRSVVFMGDLNVAHHEIDLARPEEALKGTGFLPIEREQVDKIIEHGYVDTFRAHHPGERDAYTFWDPWRDRRARNIGWRIDYVFVSDDIASNVTSAFIEPQVMSSDHCPVGIELDLPA